MNVLAINGSPRLKNSATFHILDNLLVGMREAGASTDLIHLREQKIQPCTGCFSCWVKTPGQCILKDDMAPLLDKLVWADLTIYGTPLYHFNMTGLMKNFIDRTLPLFEPWLIKLPTEPNLTTHPHRAPKQRSMFLVSVAGFPEFDHFAPLVETFKYNAKIGNTKYLGEILRPYGETMASPDFQKSYQDYYELLRQAGKALVEEGRINDDLQAQLREPLFKVGPDVKRRLSTRYWESLMDKNQVPESLRRGAAPFNPIPSNPGDKQ
jgi:putative NADPH-quinone reductase